MGSIVSFGGHQSALPRTKGTVTMGPHGLSFNIEQTPTGGVNVTVQPAGGVRGEVRVNGVSSEIPATTARAPMGNRGGAAGASRSSACDHSDAKASAM